MAILRRVGAGVVPCLTPTGTMEHSRGASAPLGRGGLQALAKASIWNNQWAVVPREKLSTDERRNLRAVRLALEPLLWTAPTVE